MEDQIFQFDQKYILHPLPLRLELDKADPEVQKVELLDYYFQSQELNFPVIAILFDLNNIQFDPENHLADCLDFQFDLIKDYFDRLVD